MLVKDQTKLVSRDGIKKIQSNTNSFYNPTFKARLFKYTLPFIFVAIALAIKLRWDFVLGHNIPSLLFFSAITMSAFKGGLGPGILATILSAFLIGYFFLPPFWSFSGHDKYIQLGFFALEGLMISYISESRKRSGIDKSRLLLLEHRARTHAQKEIENRKRVESELLRSNNELAIIFREVADGITVQDPSGKLLFANIAAARICGFSTSEEFITSSPQKIMDKFEIFDEEGNALPMEKLPGRVALVEKKSAELLLRFRIKESNEERWSIVKASPVMDERNNVQFSINVFQDVTDRKLLEQKKDEFMSMVSHELKTPMTSIQGFTHLLQKNLNKSRDPKAKRYVEYMSEEVAKMSQMVGDLLEATRIRVGKLKLNKTHFRLSEFLEATVEAIQFISSEHRIILENKVQTQVFADRIRLSQVLTNFLTNAIKYSPSSSKIIIRAEKNEKEVTVSVEDFGIGISKKDLDEVFNLFYQSNDPARPSRGLGVGLYISSEIIKQHGGKIWGQSIPKKGSIFFFSLPLEK